MRVSVEEQVALAVRAAGGEVLADMLPKDPGFLNADYLFRADAVVAELKRFEHQGLNDPKLQRKGSALFHRYSEKWREQGRTDIPIAYGRVRIDVRAFPSEFGRDVLGLLRDTFQSSMRKANRQVRETAAHCSMANARGLLLFCIDGDSDLTLETVGHVFDRLLRGPTFTSISSIVVFSANCAFALPGLHPVRPFLVMGKEDRASVPIEVVRRFAGAWQDRMNAIGGPPALFLSSACPEPDLQRMLRLPLRPIEWWTQNQQPRRGFLRRENPAQNLSRPQRRVPSPPPQGDRGSF